MPKAPNRRVIPMISFKSNKSRKVQPELKLLTAMIDRLIRDLIGETEISIKERRFAVNYVLSDDDGTFSFKFVCHELEFSSSFIRFIRDLAIRAKTRKKQSVVLGRKQSLRANHAEY